MGRQPRSGPYSLGARPGSLTWRHRSPQRIGSAQHSGVGRERVVRRVSCGSRAARREKTPKTRWDAVATGATSTPVLMALVVSRVFLSTQPMQELIAQLVTKAELNPEQAAKVAEVVKGFLADKLPEPIKGAVLGAISAESVDSAADQAKGLLGNLAGKMF